MPSNLNKHELKTLIVYWSATGNTEKVANTIRDTLVREGITPIVRKVADAASEELYDYNLVFFGSPTYMWQPPEPVQKYIEAKMEHYRNLGSIKPCAPVIPGKKAVIFITYSGPHTGIKEATPAGDYLEQFFEHIGFEVVAKWYTVGEFHGQEELSTKGKLGDIRGRPDHQDLTEVENGVIKLLKSKDNISG